MGENIHTVTVKTDRSHLHDTDSGMNRQEAYRVNQLESKIRGRKTEKGYIVGANGEVLGESVKGTRGSAKFYVTDLIKSKDAIMTHNHPTADLMGSMAGQIGVPFSNTDLLRAVQYNQKEVRAVTPTYTFSVRRPKGGWGDMRTIENALRQWDADRMVAYRQYMNDSVRKRGISIAEASDRGNVGGQWSAWRKAMKTLGWQITRKRVK